MKLILPFRMELDISKKEFNNRLRTIMMEHYPGLFMPLDLQYICGCFNEAQKQ